MSDDIAVGLAMLGIIALPIIVLYVAWASGVAHGHAKSDYLAGFRAGYHSGMQTRLSLEEITNGQDAS